MASQNKVSGHFETHIPFRTETDFGIQAKCLSLI